jgi:hypothetical protein
VSDELGNCPLCLEPIKSTQRVWMKNGELTVHSSCRDREAALRRQEAVDHPAHYGGADNPYEAIRVIEAWSLDFCLGNAVKYVARAGKKGSEIEDLRKAAWYIQRRIEQLEREF